MCYTHDLHNNHVWDGMGERERESKEKKTKKEKKKESKAYVIRRRANHKKSYELRLRTNSMDKGRHVINNLCVRQMVRVHEQRDSVWA